MSGGESRDMEVDARMSEFLGQSPQLGEEFLHTLQSEFLFESVGIPDADDGFAVDLPVVRLVEVAGDDVRKAAESLLVGEVRSIETGRIGISTVSALRGVKNVPGV